MTKTGHASARSGIKRARAGTRILSPSAKKYRLTLPSALVVETADEKPVKKRSLVHAHMTKKVKDKLRIKYFDDGSTAGLRVSGVKATRSPAQALVFVDPRARAKAAGAAPGERLNADQARAVLLKIAEDSKDLFVTVANAETYLGNTNFAGTGKSALGLIKQGGAATVIGRLDELRFGPQG
jgi:hypothetical protein